MAYQDLRDEIQVLLDGADYEAIRPLITPENIDLVNECAPELVLPPPATFAPAYAFRLQLYESLPGRFSDAGTVDGVLAFFSSVWAGIVALGEATNDTVTEYDRLVSPNYLTRLSGLDIAHNEKTEEVC